MNLEQVAHFNDLSPEFRKKLVDRVKSFGKTVRYKFNIAKQNPDPTNYNGDKVWPSKYTLDPCVFNITDPFEKREGKSASKRVGLIDNIDSNGKPDRFRKIRVNALERGVLSLNVEDKEEDFYTAMLMEIHPKVKNGYFPEKVGEYYPVERIDEISLANEERKLRSARKVAMDTAEKMDDKEVREFADAMLWDSTEEMAVLRNKLEDLAEHSPELFNDKISDKKTKYLSSIKRALDKKIWQYNPEDGKLSWASTGQPIVILGANAGIEGWDKYAEWFMTAGEKADNVYKKLVELEKPSAKPS